MPSEQTAPRRIVILASGRLDAFTAKTAAGVIRYRRDEVIGVIDPDHAGHDLEDLIGVGAGIPIVGGLADLAAKEPDMLLIGVATPGGKLPEGWRPILRDAIRKGMEIVNGLHTFFGDDAELAALAAQHGACLRDVRRPPEVATVGMARSRQVHSRVVLTVGSDCNVGKKIAAIEIAHALRQRGEDALFLPTGQTGVMITGRGIAIDRVISDFVSGAVEQMVLAHAEHDWLIVEGQGGLCHPSYSGVTLSLMHGACPAAMVLCHQPTRTCLRHTDLSIPPLSDLVALHESIMGPVHPSRVVAAALNCVDQADAQADASIRQYQGELGLPVTDVIRRGADPIVDALQEHFAA